jgi:hypothetical protein
MLNGAGAKTPANVGRVSPQGVTRQDGDGVLPQDVGLRCANPTYSEPPDSLTIRGDAV